MLVIQERDGNNLPAVSYTRGRDLSGSGSLSGAGGIGGLLARTDAANGQSACYHADGNGNVTSMVNSQQIVVAKYIYDPFGNTLSKAGTLADANTYRFNSKEYHQNSGLYYYGYRFYDANLQRWLNSDPLDDLGFRTIAATLNGGRSDDVNLYAFVGNNPVGQIDPLGLLRFDKKCKPSDVERMKKDLKARCKTAKDGDCFRCLSKSGQDALSKMCDEIDKNTGPKVICEDANNKDCKNNTDCGWTGPLGGIHICMDKINDPTKSCSQVGCSILHEGAHSVGGVKDDTNPTSSPKADNRGYAIAKCAGCAVNPNIPLPPGY